MLIIFSAGKEEEERKKERKKFDNGLLRTLLIRFVVNRAFEMCGTNATY